LNTHCSTKKVKADFEKKEIIENMIFLLDKSIFVSVKTEKLQSFIQNNCVVLPETLFYECYSSDDLYKKKHFVKLDALIKAGAYVSYQLVHIIGVQEAKNLYPCKCIISYDCTNKLKSEGFREEKTISKEEVYKKKKDRSKVALAIKELATKIYQKNEFNYPDVIKEIKSLNMKRIERLNKWIKYIDKSDIHEKSIEIFCKYIIDSNDSNKFCLTDDWIAWHYTRLIYLMAYEYIFKKITGKMKKDENAEKDFMDIEYIAFLAKSDVLLTRDNECQDIANAMYPKKLIRSWE